MEHDVAADARNALHADRADGRRDGRLPILASIALPAYTDYIPRGDGPTPRRSWRTSLPGSSNSCSTAGRMRPVSPMRRPGRPGIDDSGETSRPITCGFTDIISTSAEAAPRLGDDVVPRRLRPSRDLLSNRVLKALL